MADALVERKMGAFDPSEFHDRYEEALTAMLEAKKAGRKPAKAPKAPAATQAGRDPGRAAQEPAAGGPPCRAPRGQAQGRAEAPSRQAAGRSRAARRRDPPLSREGAVAVERNIAADAAAKPSRRAAPKTRASPRRPRTRRIRSSATARSAISTHRRAAGETVGQKARASWCRSMRRGGCITTSARARRRAVELGGGARTQPGAGEKRLAVHTEDHPMSISTSRASSRRANMAAGP